MGGEKTGTTWDLNFAIKVRHSTRLHALNPSGPEESKILKSADIAWFVAWFLLLCCFFFWRKKRQQTLESLEISSNHQKETCILIIWKSIVYKMIGITSVEKLGEMSRISTSTSKTWSFLEQSFQAEKSWCFNHSQCFGGQNVNHQLGGGFKYFLIFTPIWERFPFWQILFNRVETTN